MKLHNGGTLGLGTSRNVSGILNSLLQQHCDGSFFNGLLFTFSALKKPATELKLSFMLGEKYVNKINYFYYCHGNKRSNRMNNRSKLRLFDVQPPLPPGFPESLTPPPARISRIPSVVGVWIFSGTTQTQ